MRHLSLFILFLITFQSLSAQTELAPVLQKLVQQETADLDEGLQYYAQGDYDKAFELLQRAEPSNIPLHKKFLRASLLYQRDYSKLRNLKDSTIDLPQNYAFYIKHSEMDLTLSGETAIPLTNNRFKATIGEDTLIVLLDTGGSGVGIEQKWVEKLDMPYDTSISMTGVLPFFDNATFKKHPVLIPALKIGDMQLRNIPAEYSSFTKEERAKVEAVGLPEFDIIMGLDVFIGLLGEVEFDQTEGMIHFRSEARLEEGMPFLFYSSKPFTSYSMQGERLTTVLDTGSPSDMMDKSFYLNSYSKKEQKTYKQYEFIEYTVEMQRPNRKPLTLKFRDYTEDQNLVIGGQTIDFLIGFKHSKIILNLEDNLLRID